MASWKKTIISPFRKACTIFNQQPRDPKRSHSDSEQDQKRVDVRDLQGEVMACGYEDVHVMWSILDKANSAASAATAAACNVSS